LGAAACDKLRPEIHFDAVVVRFLVWVVVGICCFRLPGGLHMLFFFVRPSGQMTVEDPPPGLALLQEVRWIYSPEASACCARNSAMHFEVAQPHCEIAAWVAAGVHLAFDSAGTDPLACHFPALVEGGLTLVLEGQFLLMSPSGAFVALPRGFLSGPRAVPLTLYRTPRLRCVGLRLHPTGTQALLQASPLCLPHQIADAADVFGHAWSALADRIRNEPSAARCLAHLLDFAGTRLRGDAHAQRVRRATTLQHAALRIVSPQDALGLSVRQFERVFAATFGLRPKLFQRVARVESLLRDALANGRTDAEVALRHGYYDQSHMARELRELAGAPLRTLAQAVRQPDSEHWALAVGTHKPDTRA
jgi:AraC-like DNA-binding protein